MTFIEELLQKNKRYILSSKYQNVEYNGKSLYDLFGEPQKSIKKNGSFCELLNCMVEDIVPMFTLEFVYKHKDKLNKFENLLLRNNNRYIKIKDLLEYIGDNKVVLSLIQPPTFMTRRYKLYYENIETGENYLEYCENINNVRIKKYYSLFKLINEDNVNEMFGGITIDDYNKLREAL